MTFPDPCDHPCRRCPAPGLRDSSRMNNFPIDFHKRFPGKPFATVARPQSPVLHFCGSAVIFVCSPNGFLRIWLGGSRLKSVWVPRVPVRKSGDRFTVLSDADVCALCLSRVSNPLGGDMVTVQGSAFQDIENSYFLLVFIRFLASCDFRTYEQRLSFNCFTRNVCFPFSVLGAWSPSRNSPCRMLRFFGFPLDFIRDFASCDFRSHEKRLVFHCFL